MWYPSKNTIDYVMMHGKNHGIVALVFVVLAILASTIAGRRPLQTASDVEKNRHRHWQRLSYFLLFVAFLNAIPFAIFISIPSA